MIRMHTPPKTTPAGANPEQVREGFLKDSERLGMDDRFRFGCHPGVPCFNACCDDVNIVLTPYDILRLKRRLGMTSGDFLRRHTVMPLHESQQHPAVMLQMREDSEDGHRPCPFVDPETGCTVYEDRPWACRMFPLGKASPDEVTGNEPFHFMMPMDVCKGWEEDTEWTVAGYREDQGVAPWDAAEDEFAKIVLHPFFLKGGQLTPQQLDMFVMVCYDLDRFREFVFGSSLLKRIDLDNALRSRMRKHDEALLEFGYLWLRFALFQEPVLTPKR